MESYSDFGIGGAFAALMAGIVFISILPAIIMYVLSAVFYMRLFEKAGIEGKWRGWVPVYNSMVFFKLGDVNPWLVPILLGSGIVLIFIWIGGLVLVALFVVSIMAAVRVSIKAKGEPAWVALYAGVPGIGSLVWLGMMAFTATPWNGQIAPPSWAGGVLADKTEWQGFPPPSGFGDRRY